MQLYSLTVSGHKIMQTDIKCSGGNRLSGCKRCTVRLCPHNSDISGFHPCQGWMVTWPPLCVIERASLFLHLYCRSITAFPLLHKSLNLKGARTAGIYSEDAGLRWPNRICIITPELYFQSNWNFFKEQRLLLCTIWNSHGPINF